MYAPRRSLSRTLHTRGRLDFFFSFQEGFCYEKGARDVWRFEINTVHDLGAKLTKLIYSLILQHVFETYVEWFLMQIEFIS